MNRTLLIVLLALWAGGCLRPPAPLDYAILDEITVAEAQSGGSEGRRVRWGGTIVSVVPEATETCFEIVSRPLDRRARPRRTDETGGRFLACATGFYDPAVYAAERALTVVGTLAAPLTRTIGDYEYRYPVLHAQALYLWPAREPEPAYRTGVSFGWYYWDGPYYWGGPSYYYGHRRYGGYHRPRGPGRRSRR